MLIAYLCAAAVICLDQLSKILIYGTAARSILGNILWFESTLNTGVAFSMFSGNSVVFFVIACIASLVISYLIYSKRWFKNKAQKISLALILGGTISNAIDRLIFGGVRDFIYLKFINFAIFNIADMAITIGAILLCGFIIFSKDNKTDDRT